MRIGMRQTFDGRHDSLFYTYRLGVKYAWVRGGLCPERRKGRVGEARELLSPEADSRAIQG